MGSKMQSGKIQIDQWLELVNQSYLAPPVSLGGDSLPGFPSDVIQLNTTGQKGVATLNEAANFYKDCVTTFAELDKPIGENNRLLDFGVGWGRIARYFLRDMNRDKLFGVDVTSEAIQICRETFRSENFLTCNPYPPTEMPNEHFDFIVGYSVFSHLSEEACLAWMKEFFRILVPGGLIAITTRGRPFFDFCESQAKIEQSGYLEALGRLFPNFEDARNRYDRGQFVHSNVLGIGGGGAMNSSFYGETFISEEYARKAYEPFLHLEKFMYDTSYQSHPIMFFRKT
jgi:SAM-dependent methyltransferase